jgi:hypothetical protein
MYRGPYLIIKVIQPCNYVLQKSARSKTFMTHADKLKEYSGETPKSWLLDEQTVQEPPTRQETAEEDSFEGSDREEIEQGLPVTEEPTPVDGAPEETESEEVQQPVVLEEVVKDVPGSDERALRDRGRLRRPARFVD